MTHRKLHRGEFFTTGEAMMYGSGSSVTIYGNTVANVPTLKPLAPISEAMNGVDARISEIQNSVRILIERLVHVSSPDPTSTNEPACVPTPSPYGIPHADSLMGFCVRLNGIRNDIDGALVRLGL